MSASLRLPLASPAGEVVESLRDRLDPAHPPMLIGAEAGDILHRELGHTFETRATQDVDLAFVIPDWAAYDRLVSGLTVIPDSGIAFRVAGLHVDIMAFGPVEAPQGTVRPPFREADPLDVFGMAEVYGSSRPASFGDGLDIRLPTIGGYVALKLKAWVDRSAVHNRKDAPDLGLALFWAGESASFTDRFWDDHELFGQHGADAGRGGAAVLGGEVRLAVGDTAAGRLAALFTADSRDRLARTLEANRRDYAVAEGDGHRVVDLGDAARRGALIDAFAAGLVGA